jgi:undecaprenyl-diphosphatase
LPEIPFIFANRMDTLLELDRNLSLSVNQFHFSWLDPVMIFWSQKWVWLPLYAWILWILFRSLSSRHFYSVLVLIAFSITLSDQTSSALLKPFFERLRPCHDPDLQNLLRLPDGCGGQFGFASSHAANSFCLAFFVFLILGNSFRKSWFLFFWALVTGWSRIYLGAHFAGDILAGYVIGAVYGGLAFYLLQIVTKRRSAGI